MEKTLWNAAIHDKVEEVKDILRKNPSLNINWKNEQRDARTALYSACFEGHDSVVSILLAHPGISPNLKQKDGYTPFMIACCNGNTSCVRLLLQDQRVMVNEPSNNGATPLRVAAYYGHHSVIKWWIASEREMNLGKAGDVDYTDAIGAAKKWEKTEVVNLESFKSDPAKTRSEVKLELGITNGKSVSQSVHLAHLSLSLSLSILSCSFPFLGFVFWLRSQHSSQFFRFPSDHSTKAHPGAV